METVPTFKMMKVFDSYDMGFKLRCILHDEYPCLQSDVYILNYMYGGKEGLEKIINRTRELVDKSVRAENWYYEY